MSTMQKLNEAMPTSDDPAPVLLVEDDDCSMFNKYKRTMLMLHFANSNVDMTVIDMETKWNELLKATTSSACRLSSNTNHSTFARYAPLTHARLCVAENAATPEQRAAIDRFDEAKATYEPHRALYKHQDEQYRLMKDNLTDNHAMIVFDFSPYNATALQLTQEESRRSGMQVLHVVVIRSSTKARSTTTTGVFRSFVRCHFHIFGTAGGNDLKFHYIDFVLESGSTNDYAFLKTALVRRRMSFVSSCVTI